MRYKRKKEPKMNTFSDFLAINKEKVRRIAESNTTRNQNGYTVITRNDPWRQEKEWDAIYKKLSLSDDK